MTTAGPTLAEELSRLEWEAVASSNLQAVAYSPDFRRLWVKFHPSAGQTARVYVYLDVPESTYRGLKAAFSKGEFFARRVKNSFGFIRVR